MDLSSYLADRTCSHVREFVGKGSGFRGDWFRRKPEFPNSFDVFGGYNLSVDDGGVKISLVFEGKGVNNSLRNFADLKVDGRYDEVVRKVRVRRGEDTFTLELYLVPEANADGRTQNKDKLFYAVYNVGMKPVFKALSST